MDPHYTIFGSPISLFTRKLESAMQFYNAPYSIEKKRDDNRETIEKRAGTHQIPVLKTPENWMLADTTPVLMLLDSRFIQRRLFPTGPLGVLVHIVEEVLDEWVARVMVHYRWHHDLNTRVVISEILNRQVSIREARKTTLAQWGLRACRATGTENPTQQAAAEREYIDMLFALNNQLSDTAYSLGDRPCAVDAALIGGLRGHTNRDPLPNLSEFSHVLEWNGRSSTYSECDGAWADFPDSTPFADHILKLARTEYKPFILGNKTALANEEKTFVANTYGEPVRYLSRPYPERSRRMVATRISSLPQNERRQVVEWLEGKGLRECFSL